MKIIGLGHYSRTGKDSLAGYLVENFARNGLKAKKMSFAWKLKEICHDLYGWAGVRTPEHYDTPEGGKDRTVRLPLLATDKYPDGPTVVELWIDFGTPAVREQVYDMTWVNYVLKTDHDCDLLIVPDVRFFNEVKAIKDEGGLLIKVVRPGYSPRESVADLNLLHYRGWDAWVGGSGALRELKEFADELSVAMVAGMGTSHISGFTGPYQELCSYAEQDHLSSCVAEEAIDKWAVPSEVVNVS